MAQAIATGKNTIAHSRAKKAAIVVGNSSFPELKKVFFRFDPTPVSGLSRGLLLVLDRHSDLASASSIPESFKVICDMWFDREENIKVEILGLGSNN